MSEEILEYIEDDAIDDTENIINSAENLARAFIKERQARLEAEARAEEAEARAQTRFDNNLKVRPGGFVSHRYPKNVSTHRDETLGIKYITYHPGKPKPFDVNIHHDHDVTGRDTTYGGVYETLFEAVVARNNDLLFLVSTQRISEEKYLKAFI